MFCHENNHINKNVNLENNFILVVAVMVSTSKQSTHAHTCNSYPFFWNSHSQHFSLRVLHFTCFSIDVCILFLSLCICRFLFLHFHSTCLYSVLCAFRHAKCSPSIHRSSNSFPAIHSNSVNCICNFLYTGKRIYSFG